MAAMLGARSATTAILRAAAGCGIGADHPIVLTGMAPGAAYADAALVATVTGRSFRPAYRFDASTGTTAIDVHAFGATLLGAATVPFQDLTWENLTSLAGQLPAGIPAGVYDLEVRDPSGFTTRLPGAFTALGADGSPPT